MPAESDGTRLTTWVCEFCGYTATKRRPEGQDPPVCESCGHPRLRGFAPGGPEADHFAEQVHRRNRAGGEAPALPRGGRPNRLPRGA